jgi:hydrogenase maturation protein HypF
MIFRLKVVVFGAVQGVGFRPFVFRLTQEANLSGYVLNTSSGVIIEVEGVRDDLDNFIIKLESEKPANSIIQSLEFSFLDPIGFNNFEIRESQTDEEISAVILPDIAVCQDCLDEMYDPEDRRYLYPFINCTHCGPRFSIIKSLPYDRPNTSMQDFEMCGDCRSEYTDPVNRRFHAQPIACHVCGPHLELWDNAGKKQVSHHDALLRTIEYITKGKIIALKGLGGYQLIVNAMDDEVIGKLRHRKNREEKPFAVMFPNLETVKQICEVSEYEKRSLLSVESPIILLRKKKLFNNFSFSFHGNIAPNNPYLGVMLPYTPLHHLLMKQLNQPIIATSGNISEEPMCIDEKQALHKLSKIADYFLVHNRPIVRHVDDSIVRIIMDREMVLRRARGYAPLPIKYPSQMKGIEVDNRSYLAVGAQLKNSIAVKKKQNVFLSQHIGDLVTKEALTTFEQVISDFEGLYDLKPDMVVSDLHPDYLSTKFADEKYLNVIKVQHHEAHIAACRAENQVSGEALGISWDGTGYGRDGSVWGGEFFLSDDRSIKHLGQFRKFPLPGGEKAITEPRRTAIGLLFEMYGPQLFDSQSAIFNYFSPKELLYIKQMLIKKLNCPMSSSAGRLFDATASLLDIRQKIKYEGQAAMMLEYLANVKETGKYLYSMSQTLPVNIDWQPMFENILKDISNGVDRQRIAMKFHNTLADIILTMAQHFKVHKVVLSGGCFQNSILLTRTVNYLSKNKFHVYWHQRVPPNDGGIALGQIILADMQRIEKKILHEKTKAEKVLSEN